MIVVMQPRLDDGEAASARVVRHLEAGGLGAYVFHGKERDVIAVLGVEEHEALHDELAALKGVERVDRTTRPFKLASREVHPGGTTFRIGGATLGAELLVVAGAWRPRPGQELLALARATRDLGARVFWAGRGDSGDLRRDFLPALDELRAEVGLPVVVDVWGASEVDRLSRHADALQIPAQHMQNFPLIKEVGQGDLPVLLCRGPSATIQEWLMVAERLLQGGNMRVALCEQGIRTFEPSVPATLDFSAIAVARRLSHLPILANPSLAAGHHDLVPELSLATVAAGADGLVLDIHLGADEATAGAQAMPLSALGALVPRLTATRAALPANGR